MPGNSIGESVCWKGIYLLATTNTEQETPKHPSAVFIRSVVGERSDLARTSRHVLVVVLKDSDELRRHPKEPHTRAYGKSNIHTPYVPWNYFGCMRRRIIVFQTKPTTKLLGYSDEQSETQHFVLGLVWFLSFCFPSMYRDPEPPPPQETSVMKALKEYEVR